MIRLSDYKTETAFPAEMRTTERAALAYAFDRQKKKFLQQIRRAYIWADLKCVDDEKLDFLATESRVAFYNPDTKPDVKRNMIQNAINWHMKYGTRQAMEEMLNIAFGSKNATVESWYEYGGEPYHFRVVTGVEIEQKNVDYFFRYIRTIKNSRSRMDEMVYSFAIDYSMWEQFILIGIHFHTGIRFFECRVFDGSWLFDGSGLFDAGIRYSLAMTNEFCYGIDFSKEETIGEIMIETKTEGYWLFDGFGCMDGSRFFDSIYKKEVIS